jgi:hypothetical protein
MPKMPKNYKIIIESSNLIKTFEKLGILGI